MTEYFTSTGQFKEEPDDELKAVLRGVPSKLASSITVAGSTSLEAVKQRVRKKLADERALKEAKNVGRLRVLLTTRRSPEEIEKAERKKRTRIVIQPSQSQTVTQRISQETETDVDVKPSGLLPQSNLSLFGDSGRGLSLFGSSSAPVVLVSAVKERMKSRKLRVDIAKETGFELKKDELSSFLFGSRSMQAVQKTKTVKPTKIKIVERDPMAELHSLAVGSSKAGKKVQVKQPANASNLVNEMLFGQKRDLNKFLFG